MRVDPALRRSDTAIHFPVSQPGHVQWIEFKTIDKESWVRLFGFGEPPEGWLPINLASALKNDSSPFMGTQLTTDLQELVKTAVETHLVTERVVRGTLDLRRHPYLNADLGERSPAMRPTAPFTATLDSQDRITNLTILFNEATPDASEWQLLYHSFGARLPINPPPDTEIIEPADLNPQMLSYLKSVALL